MEARSVTSLIRDPTAWAPIALSLGALAFVLGYAAFAGGVDAGQPHDEGTPARVFQLVMLIQGLIVVVFAVRWLPRAPKPAAIILALQIGVAILPVAAIAVLEAAV